jgi:thiamine monophosphate synthase
VFPESEPPYLALITLGTSCDSETDLKHALQALHAAVSTGIVDLVSVRIDRNDDDNHNTREQRHNNPKELRLISMIQNLLTWSQQYNGFRVVVSSDWVDLGIQNGVHGVHWKEKHVQNIPTTKKNNLYDNTTNTKLLVGISTHNTSFAIEAWETYQPDYIFAGTCFPTKSHPDKTHLEGPTFPAQVVQAFLDREQQIHRRRPKVLAIGGIDATNCRDVIMPGSRSMDDPCSAVSMRVYPDGIATIRAVLQAQDAAAEVYKIKQNMMQEKEQ